MPLLSIASDPKTIKGQKQGYRTAIIYMAPAKNSGFNLCAMSGLAGCEAACLYRAGRGAMTGTQNARLKRAELFNMDQALFMETMVKELTAFVKSARRAGFIPVVRPNGTTDIQWENIYIGDGKDTIFTLFPEVQFYDYTKVMRRFDKTLPGNYFLILSYSEANDRYRRMCMETLIKHPRVNLAVVADQLPEPFLGRPVVDGDDSDLRFIDPDGVIVRLKAKGPARKDTTGFVIRLETV
jgi:hypothetical protein